MNEKQKLILGGGALVAFLIYRSKTAQAAGLGAKPSFLSTLFPSLGPNSTGLRTTNMATGAGTKVNPNIPSSGLGVTRPATTANPPSTVAAGIMAGSSIFGDLLKFFSRPTTTTPQTAPKPQQGGSGQPSSGPSSGGGGPSSSPGRPNSGGSAGVGMTPMYDEYGNVVGAYDYNGNWIPNDQGTNFDPNTGTYSTLPLDTFIGPTQGDEFTGPYDPNAFVGPLPPGSVDENGNYTDDPPAIQVEPDYGPWPEQAGYYDLPGAGTPLPDMPVWDSLTDPITVVDGSFGMDGSGYDMVGDTQAPEYYYDDT